MADATVFGLSSFSRYSASLCKTFNVTDDKVTGDKANEGWCIAHRAAHKSHLSTTRHISSSSRSRRLVEGKTSPLRPSEINSSAVCHRGQQAVQISLRFIMEGIISSVTPHAITTFTLWKSSFQPGRDDISPLSLPILFEAVERLLTDHTSIPITINQDKVIFI